MSKFNVYEMISKSTNRVLFEEIDPNIASVYVVGDIHGCFVEMKELVDKCYSHAKQSGKIPFVIFMGDVIDRGPDFLDIFKFIEDQNIVCILGNHELNFYLEAIQVKECRSKARRYNHNKFVGYDKDTQSNILEMIGNMPNGIIINFVGECNTTTFRDFVLTHSPIKDIEYTVNTNEEFDVVHLMNGPQCSMRADPVDYEELYESFDGVMMLHGHQSWNFKPIQEQNEEQKDYTNRVINLDSGVVYGYVLTAMCINTNECIEVKAKKVYSGRN